MIERELERVFRRIHADEMLAEKEPQQQAQNLSWVMAELNIIHPFREGNGRSIRELIRCMALHYELLFKEYKAKMAESIENDLI